MSAIQSDLAKGDLHAKDRVRFISISTVFFFISSGVWFGGISRSSLALSCSLSLGKFVVSFMGDASECLARRRRQRQRLRRQSRQRRLLLLLRLLRYAIEDRRARRVSARRESESESSSKTQRYIQPGANDKATRVQQKPTHTHVCRVNALRVD